MATKDFSFLFYVNDFESGTIHMTDQELGCYLRLLLAQFKRDNLPDDPEFLKRFCDSFDKSWPIVKEKFIKGDDGFLQNKRMDLEKNKRKTYSEGRGSNRKGGKSYDNHMNNICGSHEEHMINGLPSYENHMENENDYANGYVDFRDKSVREGEPVVVQMKPELFNNLPVVISMVKDFRSHYPADLKDEQDNVYARLIAVYITDTLSFEKNSYEKEKKKEVLDYWNELLKFSVTDGFYRRFTLQMLSTKKNYNGLVKSYRDSLKNKLNGNGTTGIATKAVGKTHDASIGL